MKVVVVPATYNEKGSIERLITIMEEEVFPKIKNHDMHILVADDSSPDGTADIVRALMKKYKNLDVQVGEKKGLGAAYLRAMSHAIERQGADILVSMDADLQHDPHALPLFLKKIDEGYDIVTGTRYSDGGSMPKNWPLYRKILSVGANTVVRLITGRFHLHDWTGGFRAYRKEVFLKERNKLSSFSGYTFQVAALYKSLLDRYKIGEVPIHFYSRRVGDSKIAPAEYIYNLFKYVITERIHELRIARLMKFLVVGGTGFLVQILLQEATIRFGFTTFLAGGLSGLIDLFVSHTDISTLSQSIGAAIGAESAIISNFFLNNYWTFHDTRGLKQRSNGFIRLFKFNMTSFMAIFIQAAAVWIGIKWFGDHMMFVSLSLPTRIAVLIPTIILLVIPLNYLIYNKIIWKTQYLQHGTTSKT